MGSKYQPNNFKLKIKRGVSGLGLFAEEPIPKGTCIIEYVGRVISEAEEYTSRSQYLFEVNSKTTIDGQARSNLARYINHSCRPNAEVDIWHKRVFIMARRQIKVGEEISYDYGKDFFDTHIKPKGCRCAKCSGM